MDPNSFLWRKAISWLLSKGGFAMKSVKLELWGPSFAKVLLSAKDPGNVFISNRLLTTCGRNPFKFFFLKRSPKLSELQDPQNLGLSDDIVDKHFLRFSKLLLFLPLTPLAHDTWQSLSFMGLKLAGQAG